MNKTKEDIAMKKAIENVTLPRKAYMKPTMKVIPLYHKRLILCGSDPSKLQGKSDEYYELQ